MCAQGKGKGEERGRVDVEHRHLSHSPQNLRSELVGIQTRR